MYRFSIMLLCAGLVFCVRMVDAAPFSLYGTAFLEEITDGGNAGQIHLRFHSGPFTWTPAGPLDPLAGWDAHADGRYSYTLGPAEVLSDNSFLQDIQSEMTLSARDGDGNLLGSVHVNGVGKVAADLDTSRAIVEEDMGAIIFRYGFPLDDRSLELGTISDATGVFASSVAPGDQWLFRYAGYQGRVLVPGVDPQEGIYANPSFGLFSTFMITSVPEPSGIVLAGITMLVGCAVCSARRSVQRHRNHSLGDVT